MVTNILFILLGALIWQAITLIVTLITNDEDLSLCCGMGVWFVLVKGIGTQVRKIYLMYFKNNYYQCQRYFGKNTNDYSYIYIHKNLLNKFNVYNGGNIENVNNVIIIMKDCKNSKGLPLKSQIISNIKQISGMDIKLLKGDG